MTEKQNYFLNDYYLVEGFDNTGKTTFSNSLLKDYCKYTNNHLYFDFFKGYSVFDFLEEVKPMEKIAIEGGSPISDYCKSRLFKLSHLDDKIVEYFRDNEFFTKELGHIYLRHKNVDTAEKLYSNLSTSKFNTFSDYWIYYKTADGLYREIYNKLGITPRIFEISSDLSSWEEVF